jgi:diphthamide synthase (EF-2-diphthine--ammonia ligase)
VAIGYAAPVRYLTDGAQRYEIVALLTTVTEEFDRISMHGVRRDLLEQQADSLGISLRKIMIPKECPNEIYEARVREALSHFKAQESPRSRSETYFSRT